MLKGSKKTKRQKTKDSSSLHVSLLALLGMAALLAWQSFLNSLSSLISHQEVKAPGNVLHRLHLYKVQLILGCHSFIRSDIQTSYDSTHIHHRKRFVICQNTLQRRYEADRNFGFALRHSFHSVP